jgi:hypothetical protein
MSTRKYTADNLVPMFLKAAGLREEMKAAGFTDNGGAIHSAERILDILGLFLKYPKLSHRNNLKKLEDAEWSVGAFLAYKNKKRVLIEHVYPLRALTQDAIKAAKPLREKAAAKRLITFVRKHYRLALLSIEETTILNRTNRSRYHPKRLEEAGIKVIKAKRKKRPNPR